MRYIEITVEEAIKRCNKNTKVLVAIQDLANEDSNEVFIPKHQNEYGEIFSDVKTAASMSDDFIKQLRLFTAICQYNRIISQSFIFSLFK